MSEMQKLIQELERLKRDAENDNSPAGYLQIFTKPAGSKYARALIDNADKLFSYIKEIENKKDI